MGHTLAMILALAVRAAPGVAAAPPPARVRVVATRPGDGATWVAGALAASRRAALSARTAASVRAVEVEEGARVRRGTLLVRLSDDEIRAQLAAARTALATAAAQERRLRLLAAEQAATAVEVEQASAQRARAEAAVAAARSALAYTELRAPFDGAVQARRVNVGDVVGPGQPLLELEGSDLEVTATLSDDEARGVSIGQAIRFDANGVVGTAQVSALAEGGDPLSHRRAVRAKVVRAPAGLRSGAFARLEVHAGGAARRGGVWIPRSAIVERGDLAGVFVVKGARAQLRWLALGEAVGGRLPVRAGLDQGDAVIDAPGALRDGDRVEVEP